MKKENNHKPEDKGISFDSNTSTSGSPQGEKPLSEKNIHFLNEECYWEDDVKQALKRLKEDLGISSVITRSECFKVINKIFGDKLI